jgi:hypothetical protein
MARTKESTVKLKTFYRYTFDIRKEGKGSIMLHTLIINPEDMSQDEPARNGVTQTLGGAYTTDFGSGLPTVSISGTTGYKTRMGAEGVARDGYEEFVKFRQDVYRGFISNPDPTLSLYWYNWEDAEFYEIQPQNFRLQRSKSAALMYRYEMRYTCIRKLDTTRQAVAADYLMTNPLTQPLASLLSKSVSNINEIFNILNIYTQKGGV